MGSQTLTDLHVYGHNLHEGLEPRSCPISVNTIIYGVNEVVKSNSKVKSFFSVRGVRSNLCSRRRFFF